MQYTIVYGAIGTLALGAFLWRVFLASRNPGDAALWAVAVAVFGSLVSYTTATPYTYTRIGEESGIPNLATLIIYGVIDAALLAQTVLTSRIVRHDAEKSDRLSIGRGGMILTAGIGALTLMAVLFFLAPIDDAIHPIDFDYVYATVPLATGFLTIHFTLFTAALVSIIRLCRASIPEIRHQTWLRRGLRCLSAGSGIALGYSLGKLIAIIGAWWGLDLRALNIAISPALANIGGTVMLIGYVLPSFAPWSIRSFTHIRASGTLRALCRAHCGRSIRIRHRTCRRPVACGLGSIDRSSKSGIGCFACNRTCRPMRQSPPSGPQCCWASRPIGVARRSRRRRSRRPWTRTAGTSPRCGRVYGSKNHSNPAWQESFAG